VTLETCDPPSLNTANCSKYTWNSVAIVAFSGTELERIFTNEGNTVVMQHYNLTGVVKGPLGVIMRYYIPVGLLGFNHMWSLMRTILNYKTPENLQAKEQMIKLKSSITIATKLDREIRIFH
jgi:hypothetical protein